MTTKNRKTTKVVGKADRTTDLTPGERKTITSIVNGTHPTISFENKGASSSDFQGYQNAFIMIAEKSPTFRAMLDIIAAESKPLDIDILPRMEGKSLGRAILTITGNGRQTRSIIYSGERIREPEQALFAIPNEIAHVMQMLGKSVGGRNGNPPKPLIELESDLVSYQVIREYTGKDFPRMLGNHGWPQSLQGYDFRVARALGMDINKAVADGRKADGLPPIQGLSESILKSENPLSENPRIAAILKERFKPASQRSAASVEADYGNDKATQQLIDGLVSFDTQDRAQERGFQVPEERLEYIGLA